MDINLPDNYNENQKGSFFTEIMFKLHIYTMQINRELISMGLCIAFSIISLRGFS